MKPFRVGVTRDFGPAGELEGSMEAGLREVLGEIKDLTYEYLPEYKAVMTPDQTRDFDVVITGGPLWTAESFRGSSRLTGIAYYGVGYDDIDVAAATEADVVVSIATPAVRRPMAESALAFMLALSKNMLVKDRLTRAGRSEEKMEHHGVLVRDRVVGCIGMGNIGSDFVKLLEPLNPARVIAFSPSLDARKASEIGVETVDLETLLQEADFVVVMCPLNDQTRGMLGTEQFRLMKKSAYLINVSRGKIIRQAELVQALEQRWIRGAALDVFVKEPPDADDPLMRLENVIVTAHCIGFTEELFHDISVEDCLAALSIYHGRSPAYAVNPAVLGRPGFQSKLARYRHGAGDRTVSV